MIDRKTVKQGLTALAVAIAGVLEDVHERAVTRQTSLDDYGEAATDLAAAGADVTVLAAAMQIFVRRGEVADEPLD